MHVFHNAKSIKIHILLPMTHLDTVRIVPADEKKHRIFCQAPQPFEEGSLSASVFPMFASYGTQSLFGPQQPFSEVKPVGSI